MSVQVGDVIVFVPVSDKQTVVHRIIKLTPSGLCTRGDSNSDADRYLVQPEDVQGRVVAAWRGRQRRNISGGRVALIRVNVSQCWQFFVRPIYALLYPLYVAPARSGITRRLLPVHLRPRIVAFRTDGRRQLRLLLGRHLVGHYEDNRGRWTIRRPFRLLVDERLLPTPRDFGKSEHTIRKLVNP
jgi:hypothetical protein